MAGQIEHTTTSHQGVSAEHSTLSCLDLSKRMITHMNRELTVQMGDVDRVNLDQNNISKLENLSHLTKLQQLSASHNCLIKISGLETLRCLTVLNLPENSICSIEGVENLTQLVWLNLSGNNIRQITNLHNNLALKHLDLSDNTISAIGELSPLYALRTLLLHGNIIRDISGAANQLPRNLSILSLAENEITELCQVRHLQQLKKLEQLSVMNNPCVSYQQLTHHSDSYRAFVISWSCNLQVLDGRHVTTAERQYASSLLEDGASHKFLTGEQAKLVAYLTKVTFSVPSSPTRRPSLSHATIPEPVKTQGHIIATEENQPIGHSFVRRSRSEEQISSPSGGPTSLGIVPSPVTQPQSQRVINVSRQSPMNSPTASPLMSRRDMQGLIRQVIGQERSPLGVSVSLVSPGPATGTLQGTVHTALSASPPAIPSSLRIPKQSAYPPKISRSRSASLSPTREKRSEARRTLIMLSSAEDQAVEDQAIASTVQPSVPSANHSSEDKERSECATKIQALWRGYRTRNLNPNVTALKQELRTRRLEETIVFLIGEMNRQHQLNSESQIVRNGLVKSLMQLSEQLNDLQTKQ